MERYPHTCIILEPPTDLNNPYLESAETKYTQVYTGKCRCFANKQSTYSPTKTMECDYCVSVPNPKMADIGENYKVAVKFPDSPSQNRWNIVGYVKDFERYDRNCLIYIQMSKENLIESDIPT